MLSNLEFEVRPGEFNNVVDDFATTFYPELYTGISIDSPGVIVHRMSTPGLPLDAALRRRFPDVRLRFADSLRCRSELMALTHRIHRDHEQWKSRGVHLTSWGPDVKGFVKVRIQETTESAMEEIRAHYGEAVVVRGGVRPGVGGPHRKQREITSRRH
ncbi:hypothetical protein [Tenggerimyces flavus]|uniref:Uncharacterized protein n=1 Tax=Tenggerimyces flavus TaxID=1708749 RepID=A0ABV7YP99_9ACTN|nr:hypothetical protein [Tenggerimyces flavus]MBM7787767.1 hypothetical protein [Tenggerimyces flavus]